ncbi:hypothetical protein [Dyadobacter sp. NIV53]|uniref:hypothetical protein n=1 Tax=Dyadobacter sp. NIV53 TaxID=2861765 RepID=UPI001C86E3E1|nr:hypothetical protein [Dyadobacter sp. NIV53]
MEITLLLHSKFILTLLVLSGTILAPVTGSAQSYNVTANEKGGVIYKDLVSNRNTVCRITCDCAGLAEGNYLIQLYDSKDSEAKIFMAGQDSWEIPIAKTG